MAEISRCNICMNIYVNTTQCTVCLLKGRIKPKRKKRETFREFKARVDKVNQEKEEIREVEIKVLD